MGQMPPPPLEIEVGTVVHELDAPEIIRVEEINPHVPPVAPPPPPPLSPLDHVIEMAKKGAIFYYEGKKISSDKAIDVLKKNNKINIDTRGSNGNRPVVRLSIEPFEIDN
jgi:hypothetical protein